MISLRKNHEKIRDTVVSGYYRIENSVVSRYERIENSFISAFIAKEGESTIDAKRRITNQRDFILEKHS